MPVLDKLSVPTEGENIGTLMPKLQNRFRVTLVFEDDSKYATTNVVSVTRPQISHEEVVLDTYNSKIYLAGKHSWNEITIEFRDDVENQTNSILDQQMSRQIDMASQSVPKAGSSYKFEVIIETLAGANPNPEVLDTWNLFGSFILNLAYGDSNYSSSEPNTITATIRYDNAEHIVDGNDILSGGTQDNDLSGSTT